MACLVPFRARMHTTEHTSFYSRITAAVYFRDYGEFSGKIAWVICVFWELLVSQEHQQLQSHAPIPREADLP